MADEKLTMKELQEFPVIFTFKIAGDTGKGLEENIKNIFKHKPDATFREKVSEKGNYISISVTAEVETYEELEKLYGEISKVSGIRFYV